MNTESNLFAMAVICLCTKARDNLIIIMPVVKCHILSIKLENVTNSVKNSTKTNVHFLFCTLNFNEIVRNN